MDSILSISLGIAPSPAPAIPTVIRAPPYWAARSFLFLAFTGIAPRCALSQSLHGIHTPPSRAPCFMSRAGDKCLLMHASKLAHRSRLSPCKRKSPQHVIHTRDELYPRYHPDSRHSLYTVIYTSIYCAICLTLIRRLSHVTRHNLRRQYL